MSGVAKLDPFLRTFQVKQWCFPLSETATPFVSLPAQGFPTLLVSTGVGLAVKRAAASSTATTRLRPDVPYFAYVCPFETTPLCAVD